MSANVQEITGAEFDSVVLGSKLPVVVDFWAAWCGPCRMVAPEIEKLAAAHRASVKVVKLNVDEAGAVAARYGVMSIPTIAKFEGGRVVATIVGARAADAIAREFGLS